MLSPFTQSVTLSFAFCYPFSATFDDTTWFDMIYVIVCYSLILCSVWYLRMRVWPYYRHCYWQSCLIFCFFYLKYFHQSKKTALIHAALEGHADVVQLLLDKRADVNVNDDVSIRMFRCACVSVCERAFFLFFYLSAF